MGGDGVWAFEAWGWGTLGRIAEKYSAFQLLFVYHSNGAVRC